MLSIPSIEGDSSDSGGRHRESEKVLEIELDSIVLELGNELLLVKVNS